MKSIQTKLVLIFTPVILSTLLGLGGIFIFQTLRSTTQDTRENLINLAQQEAHYIHSRINERLIYIDLLARNPILLDESMTFEEKIAYYEAEAKRTGYLAFAFAGKDGNAVVFNTKRETVYIGSRDYFQAALSGQPAVSDLIISNATGELVLIFAAPVYQQGEIIGVFYGRRDGNALSEYVSNISYKQTGYAYMINHQGVTVAHKNTDLVFAQDNDIENAKTNPSLRELGELTEDMTTRTAGSGTYTYHGVRKVVGYAPIENTPWIIVYGLEESEALERIRTLGRILSMFVLAAGAVGVGITYLISARISKPLMTVSKVMDDYGNHVSTPLPPKYLKRNDEIGVLSKGITLMLNSISNHISDLEEKNQELLHTKEVITLERLLFETTLHSLSDGVISTDRNGNIQILNEVAERLTGWKNEDAHGLPFDDVFNIINEDNREKCSCPIKKILQNSKANVLDEYAVLIGKAGDEIPIENSAAPILDRNGNITGVVIVFRDCTEKRKAQAEISFLSYHDRLTGLYNRHFFEEALIKLDAKSYFPLSLAMLDVNGLKLTNDAFGHQMGDQLLQIVAQTINHICRETDIISRIGGDEFILLLPKTDYSETEAIIGRIYRELEQIKLNDIVISVSAGWETKSSNEQSIMDIYAKAEENMYRKKLIESQSMRSKTIQVILRTLNETNPREQIHSENVSKISRAIGEALNLNQELLREIEMAGLLHDIGKIAIDNNVLNKPGALTDAEYEMVKRHPEIGYHILKSADAYTSISDYVLAHHERWDGAGYPRGLTGKEIPLAARIIAIADSYEAMTAERPYRNPISTDSAFRELSRCTGTQFDPDLVRVFCEDVRIQMVITSTPTVL